MTHKFFLMLQLPKSVKHSEAQSYVFDAIKTHGKGMHPSEPFFSIEPDDIEIIPPAETYPDPSLGKRLIAACNKIKDTDHDELKGSPALKEMEEVLEEINRLNNPPPKVETNVEPG